MFVATAISELLAIPHAYWIPVTVAWITKPDHDGTVTRVIQRVIGTALGLLIIGLPSLVLETTTMYYAVFAILGSAVAISFVWIITTSGSPE